MKRLRIEMSRRKLEWWSDGWTVWLQCSTIGSTPLDTSSSAFNLVIEKFSPAGCWKKVKMETRMNGNEFLQRSAKSDSKRTPFKGAETKIGVEATEWDLTNKRMKIRFHLTNEVYNLKILFFWTFLKWRFNSRLIVHCISVERIHG